MEKKMSNSKLFSLSRALVLFLLVACANSIPTNKYGLTVVPDLATYERLAARDPEQRLVDVSTIPGVRIDVRYATTNNFMHERLYPVAKSYLRAPAARALAEVQRELAAEHLGLKVFDGYRPYSITEKMWEPVKNPDFVADPAKGSRHNRGAAVDLTIVDLATGEEIAMPTPYDDFTPKAFANYAELPANVIANRAKLHDAMTRHGFDQLPSEWWHFDFHGWERFPLMNVPLEELALPSHTSRRR
jgi:D-alanyl-D-alanine dipeptidase